MAPSADQKRVYALFNQALALEPSERGAFLDEVGTTDPDLRREVEACLRASESPNSFGADMARLGRDAAADFQSVSHVGSFRIEGLLGEGGMGRVYRARHETLGREVALKLIKPGMDSGRVLARFELERRMLSRLKHPCVVRILEAGLTPEGRPYFAMDLVDGPTITRYCDRAGLSIRRRLKLFVHVCEGVYHAHLQGVVHRDLKPSNVLIELGEGGALPKIIDFGVAKMLSGGAHPATTLAGEDGSAKLTATGLAPGSVAYMSPEQASFDEAAIDARTDVYALGTMLYELLCGLPTVAAEVWAHAPFDEIFRVIREWVPPPPSAALTSAGETVASLAARRGTNPAQLGKQLKGDLDRIVMKALEKDKDRRYDSARDLRDDILHHLRGEPVSATPPTWRYLAGKYLKKYRRAVVAAGLLLLSLGLGIAGTTWGLFRARETAAEARDESAKALATVDLLRNLLLSTSPYQMGEDVKLKTLIEAFEPTLAETLEDQGEVEMQVRGILADLYKRMGLYSEAALQSRRRLALAKTHMGPIHRDTMWVKILLAVSLYEEDHLDEAEELATEVLENASHHLSRDIDMWLVAQWTQGRVHGKRGEELLAADMLYCTWLDMARLLGEDNIHAIGCMRSSGRAFMEIGNFEMAERLMSGYMVRVNQESNLVAISHGYRELADLFGILGRYQEAEALYGVCLDIVAPHMSPDHPVMSGLRNNLGNIYYQQERFQELENLFTEILEINKAVIGIKHPNTLIQLNNLGMVKLKLEKYSEAISILEQCLELGPEVFGPNHLSVCISKSNLSKALWAVGRREEALSLSQEALSGQIMRAEIENPMIWKTANTFAFQLYQMGERLAAWEIWETLMASARKRVSLDFKGFEEVAKSLAHLYCEEGWVEEADAMEAYLAERTP